MNQGRAITLARKSAQMEIAMLNAERGNVNWVATTPGGAFFTLGHFAITECERVMDLPDSNRMPAGAGIAGRLNEWLETLTI